MPDTIAILTTSKGCIWRKGPTLERMREIIAADFIRRQPEQEGSHYFAAHGIAIPLTQQAVSLAIANNIEGGLLKHQGRDRGPLACRQMLWAMLDGERLSPLGLRVMTDLFTSLAGEAAELAKRGELPSLAEHPTH